MKKQVHVYLADTENLFNLQMRHCLLSCDHKYPTKRENCHKGAVINIPFQLKVTYCVISYNFVSSYSISFVQSTPEHFVHTNCCFCVIIPLSFQGSIFNSVYYEFCHNDIFWCQCFPRMEHYELEQKNTHRISRFKRPRGLYILQTRAGRNQVMLPEQVLDAEK